MTETATRPPVPETPGKGFVYADLRDPEWRVAEEGARCRRRATPDDHACGEPAAAEKSHPNDPIWPWWAYCGEHALTYGRRVEDGHWVEDGKVLHWVLCGADGTILTQEEAARALRNWRGPADECKKHQCPPHMCPPESGHMFSFRIRADLREAAKRAAGAQKADVSEWARQAMEVLAGDNLRCPRCRDTDPPVPLEFGDLAGKPLGEWVADAAGKVKRQHPRHEPVRVGAAHECDADHQKLAAVTR